MNEIITPANIRRGYTFITNLSVKVTIIKATTKMAVIAIGDNGKNFTYKFDGRGYKRQGQYLYMDGIK